MGWRAMRIALDRPHVCRQCVRSLKRRQAGNFALCFQC